MFDWIRNKNTGVTIKIKGTKTITKEYCEKWQCHQLTTYMKFIHTYSLATLSSEDTENVNRSVTARKIQLIFSKHQNQQLNFTAEFYQTSEELTRMFFKLFQGKKKKKQEIWTFGLRVTMPMVTPGNPGHLHFLSLPLTHAERQPLKQLIAECLPTTLETGLELLVLD